MLWLLEHSKLIPSGSLCTGTEILRVRAQSPAIKQVVIFLLGEDLVCHLYRIHLWSATKRSTIKWSVPVLTIPSTWNALKTVCTWLLLIIQTSPQMSPLQRSGPWPPHSNGAPSWTLHHVILCLLHAPNHYRTVLCTSLGSISSFQNNNVWSLKEGTFSVWLDAQYIQVLDKY